MKTKTETKTETKPTPGPWKVYHEQHGVFYIGNADRLTAANGMSSERQQADAALICAAPELLQALRDCVRHNADILDNCLFPAHGLKANLTPEQALWREKIKKWNTEIRAANAKATGQN